MGVKLSITYHG